MDLQTWSLGEATETAGIHCDSAGRGNLISAQIAAEERERKTPEKLKMSVLTGRGVSQLYKKGNRSRYGGH
jgi:hypothetical protein